MSKKVSCKKCGSVIPLKRSNVKYELYEQGYKYLRERYFVQCPDCRQLQPISLTKLPFRVRWQLFRDICLKFKF